MTEPESYYDYFEQYIRLLSENWKPDADMIRFIYEDREKTLGFVSPVVIYYYEAVKCFLTRNFVGSIAASSASVEIAVNNENRKRGWNARPDKWLHLWDCLKLARKQGLPGDRLLASGFALTRDKFDHGEIFPFKAPTTGLLYVGGSPDIAVQQLRLAHDFLIALYEAEQPKVDSTGRQPIT